MDNTIRDAIAMAMEVIIASIIIGFIALLTMYSRSIYWGTSTYESAKSIMHERAKLYDYDNKTVHGVDIVDLALSNVRQYKIKLEFKDGGTNIISYDSEGAKGIKLWEQSNIEDMIGVERLYKEFSANILWVKNGDTSGNMYVEKDIMSMYTKYNMYDYSAVGVLFKER